MIYQDLYQYLFVFGNLNIYSYDENLGNIDNNYIVFVGTINGQFDKDTILYKMNDIIRAYKKDSTNDEQISLF